MSDIKQLVSTGRKHFESKNYVKAEQCFLKALKGGARYADLLNMLGVIYHQDGKFNNAITYFREALRINPNYVEANLNLAILLNDLGEYKEAKALYQKLGSKLPSLIPSNHNNSGPKWPSFAKGKKIEGTEKSKTMNPVMKGKIANMHAAIADTYSGIGRLEEAIEEYKKALALCPAYKDIQTKLAVCYRENNQKELAAKELKQTVKSDPNYLPARIQLGLTYYTKGEIKKAATEWESVLKKDKENAAAKMYLRICRNH
ncbi:MAG: tetratricopeptide repeat protein [Deltaproteobacteria bacterium]|nr:tetratricopeptide repeat protein [Deltaproteobacteria bacterium]